MKLIIEISDKTYKDVKQFYDNMSEHECIGEYELAIAEGIPLSEELEKIKEEIFDKQTEFINSNLISECNVRYGLEIAEIIIDKPISELKGEKNGND